jgi:hypothetical protein
VLSELKSLDRERDRPPGGAGQRRARSVLLLPGRFAVDAELGARLARFVGEEA